MSTVYRDHLRITSGRPTGCRSGFQQGQPEANGIAERFVRTARTECLDWLLTLGPRHLERTLTVFVDHYNGHRPHRSLDLVPPNGRAATNKWTGSQSLAIRRRDRLGGLLHEYERAA